MPRHKGEFTAEGNDKVYRYETDEWKGETGRTKINITDEDIQHSGELTIKIMDPEDPGFVAYQTIQLPWEDWDQIEYVLGIDWGDEGSRGRE